MATWFYNRMNDANVPGDLFEAAEREGPGHVMSSEYAHYSRLVLDYWDQNHRLAELVLPRD